MKKVFLNCFLICFAYAALIQWWQPRHAIAEDQEASNIITAERLLYKYPSSDVVVAGSSLIGGFKRFVDEKEIYFLGQGGGSSLEGLTVIEQNEISPRLLLVETNALTVDFRQDFAERFESPFTSFLASHLLAFRYQYRPINVFLSVLHNSFRGDRAVSVTNDHFLNSQASDLRIQRFLEAYKAPPDHHQYQANLLAAHTILTNLKAQGTEVVLVELPIYSEFIETEYHRERRAQLSEIFPQNEWNYIDWASLPDMNFTDAIHLSAKSQQKVTELIHREIFTFRPEHIQK